MSQQNTELTTKTESTTFSPNFIQNRFLRHQKKMCKKNICLVKKVEKGRKMSQNGDKLIEFYDSFQVHFWVEIDIFLNFLGISYI